MRKLVIFLLFVGLCCFLLGCSDSTNQTVSSKSTLETTRQDVIDKWKNEADVLGTGRFIEDAYKQYPDDPTIANIYFYSTAKYEYNLYKNSSGKTQYLDTAKEYAAKIDPNYSGEFSEEMHVFVNSIISAGELEKKHATVTTQEDKYNSLTKTEKKEICKYIQGRYDYYDKQNGGYAGDKYSDTIMKEAAKKYGLSVSQIEIIWMNSYSY